MGNTAQQCRLGLFQDSDFAGDLQDSKSTSGGISRIFRSHTLVPMSWMCKKQTSASHSSTESETVSLGAGLHMDGIPALDLWDLLTEVLHSSSNQPKKSEEKCRETCCMTHHQENTHFPTMTRTVVSIVSPSSSASRSTICGTGIGTIQTPERPERPVVTDKNQRSQGMTNVLDHIDCVLSNVQSPRVKKLYCMCLRAMKL